MALPAHAEWPTVLGTLASAALVAGMLSLVASPILYKGWKHRTRYHRVRDTPVATPTTADDGQTVLLRGTARAEAERTTAPVTDADALVAAWDVCRWVTERAGSTRYWLPEARGVDVAGFVIACDGEYGRVPSMDRSETVDSLSGFFTIPDTATGIDVADVDVEVDSFDTERELAPDEDPPAHLQQFAERVGLDSQPQRREFVPFTRDYGTRRFREAAVTEGQAVTVRATVNPPETPGGEITLDAPSDESMLLSTLSPTELQRRYRWAYWKSFHLFVTLIAVASLVVAVQ